jgi:hypothetical protein
MGVWTVLLILNALVGGSAFLYIWKKTERHRADNYWLEKKAISTCRRDVKRWNFWAMFLGSITFAVPRFIGVWVVFGTLALALK